MRDSLTELAVVLALILANGVFAGAEIALIAVRRSRIRQLLEERRPGARAVKELRDAPERFIATVQTGITVAPSSPGRSRRRSPPCPRSLPTPGASP